MQSTFQQRWLAVAAVGAAAGFVLAAAAPAWSQQTTASPQSGQAEQPGKLDVPAGGPTQPQALPGRGEPEKAGETGPLKEQAIKQGTGTAGTSGTAAGGVADDKLNAYVQARQQLERDDPSMKQALETGDFSGRMDNIRAALKGSQMSPEEFVQLHQQVKTDPNLRARVEAQSGRTSSGSPTSGAAAGTGVHHPAGGSEVPAGAAASPGAASSGAAPSASPK
jgi:hypothetical protein